MTSDWLESWVATNILVLILQSVFHKDRDLVSVVDLQLDYNQRWLRVFCKFVSTLLCCSCLKCLSVYCFFTARITWFRGDMVGSNNGNMMLSTPLSYRYKQRSSNITVSEIFCSEIFFRQKCLLTLAPPSPGLCHIWVH